MPPTPDLRASDEDRERVVSALGTHMAAGRLDQSEFEERMAAAYSARTFGELEALTKDLPAVTSGTKPPAPVPDAYKNDKTGGEVTPGGKRFRNPLAGWLAASGMMTAIWGMSSAATGELLPYWPMWAIVPWGIMLVATGRWRGNGRR